MSELSAFDPQTATMAIEIPPPPEVHSPSLRERFWNTRVARKLFSGFVAASGIVGGLAIDTMPAHADDSSLEFTVDADAAAGGVYARSGPHTDETQRIDGYGVYPGDTLSAICGVTDGDPVGPKNNTTWHKVIDEDRQSEGELWINDHYTDSSAEPGQLIPGEPNCNEPSEQQTQKSSEYDGNKAAIWALEHAEDPQQYGKNDEDCAWFMSQALVAGGLPQDDDWHLWGRYGFPHIPGTSVGSGAPGTETAWQASALIAYIQSKYPDSTWQSMDFSTNDHPEAQPGNLIAYDWDGNGTIDHLAMVVDDAPGTTYPEVSEWGNVANTGDSANYNKDGWSYSKVNGHFIKNVFPNAKAYILKIDTGLDGLQIAGNGNEG